MHAKIVTGLLPFCLPAYTLDQLTLLEANHPLVGDLDGHFILCVPLPSLAAAPACLPQEIRDSSCQVHPGLQDIWDLSLLLGPNSAYHAANAVPGPAQNHLLQDCKDCKMQASSMTLDPCNLWACHARVPHDGLL